MLEERLHSLCKAQHLKLALAESCTGGMIAARITSLPGASEFFWGSLVVYASEMKEKFLHVPRKDLQQFGAESLEVVQKMLEGIFTNTSADIGLAISGFAGPTGKNIGQIFIAVGKRGRPCEVLTLFLKGTRQEIITLATNEALKALIRMLQ